MFEKWGRFSYAHRRLIPAIIIAAILAPVSYTHLTLPTSDLV